MTKGVLPGNLFLKGLGRRRLELWFAAVLGVVQGLTEFLPISSTAHLRLVPTLLGQQDPGAAFSAVIQLGTLLAVVVFFARDLFIDIPKAMWKRPKSAQGRLPWYIALGTIPIVVFGLSLKKFITGDARSLWVIASALIGVGLLMFLADKKGERSRGLESLTLKDALWVGAAQTMALIPGASRSGSTIMAALFLGFKRSDAARFSFLLGIPAILGAGILEIPDALANVGSGAGLALLIGIGTSFISGYASIAWLIRFLGQNSLKGFVGYRVVTGIVIFVLVALNVVPAL